MEETVVYDGVMYFTGNGEVAMALAILLDLH